MPPTQLENPWVVIQGAPGSGDQEWFPQCSSPFSLGVGAAAATLGLQGIDPSLGKGSGLLLLRLKAALAEDPGCLRPCPKVALGTWTSLCPSFGSAAGAEFADAGLREAGRLAELHRRASFVTFRDLP